MVFVEHPPFFDRPNPYGRAAARTTATTACASRSSPAPPSSIFRSRGQRPDVFHGHDWQAGLLPVYLKSFYWDDPALYRSPTVFTIHNLAYQGNFGPDTVDVLGLPWHLASGDALEYHGGISYMKGGILFSELVTTVSPQYAREIQGRRWATASTACCAARAGDLVGILNGVDYEEWDPRHDPHIAAPYSADDLAGKAECKARPAATHRAARWSRTCPSSASSRGWCARRASTSSCDAWYDLLQRPMRMVVLGTGEPRLVQDGLRALAERAPDRFAVRFTYDEALAHKIEAGGGHVPHAVALRALRPDPDVQPALRHGAHRALDGRSVDTVEPWDAATGQGHRLPLRQSRRHRPDVGDRPGPRAYQDRAAWKQLMRNGMARDFSWDRSAEAYVGAYRRAMEKV